TKLSSRPSEARAGTQLSAHAWAESWVPDRPFGPSGMTDRIKLSLFLGDGRHDEHGRDRALVLHPMRGVLAGGERLAGAVFLGHVAAMIDDLAGEDVHYFGTVLVAVLRVGGAGLVGGHLHWQEGG